MTPELTVKQWFILVTMYAGLSLENVCRTMAFEQLAAYGPTIADQIALAELGYINDPFGVWELTDKGRELVGSKRPEVQPN